MIWQSPLVCGTKSKHVQTSKSHSLNRVLSASGIKAAGLMEMMETLWISWRLGAVMSSTLYGVGLELTATDDGVKSVKQRPTESGRRGEKLWSQRKYKQDEDKGGGKKPLAQRFPGVEWNHFWNTTKNVRRRRKGMEVKGHTRNPRNLSASRAVIQCDMLSPHSISYRHSSALATL